NIIVTEVEEERAAGTFDKLGTNLGALGFLIDMLNYQPALAKKLFVWDEANGELRPLMGRAAEEAHEAPAAVHAAAPAASAAPSPGLPPLDFAPAAAALPKAAPAPAADDEGDEELLQIFLEEAREVVGNGLAALQVLAEEPKS